LNFDASHWSGLCVVTTFDAPAADAVLLDGLGEVVAEPAPVVDELFIDLLESGVAGLEAAGVFGVVFGAGDD
jgi:hypothetical protein